MSQQEEQEQQQEEQKPSPKSIRRGCTRSLKFDILTAPWLLAEFRRLGVHVTTTNFLTQNFFGKASKPHKY